MGIYSKKRKKSGFRVLILSLFFFSVFLVLGYYFFYPNNLNTTVDKSIPETVVEMKNEAAEINETNDFFLQFFKIFSR